MDKRVYFHIVGNSRSGTTLITKYLDALPKTTVLEQPFPQLFAFFKRQFDIHHGFDSNGILYPHYQDALPYTSIDFQNYLHAASFSGDMINQNLKQPSTSQLVDFKGQLKSSSFYNFSAAYTSLLSSQFPDGKACTHLGAKHLMTEDYSNPMTKEGIKTLHIIRDPRDMIVSSSYGKSRNFVGQPLPLLFALRNWRKSARQAIKAAENQNILIIRYEDFVLQTAKVVSSLYQFLLITPGTCHENIISAMQKKWSGNSSFEKAKGLSTGSIGRYKSVLPSEITQYIEAICAHEMLALNYLSDFTGINIDAIRNFSEQGATNPLVEQGYSMKQERVNYECELLLNRLKS